MGWTTGYFPKGTIANTKHEMTPPGISGNMKLETRNKKLTTNILWRHLTSFHKAQLLKTHETGNMKHLVLVLVVLILSTAIPSGVGVGVLTGSRRVLSSSPPGSVLFFVLSAFTKTENRKHVTGAKGLDNRILSERYHW